MAFVMLLRVALTKLRAIMNGLLSYAITWMSIKINTLPEIYLMISWLEVSMKTNINDLFCERGKSYLLKTVKQKKILVNLLMSVQISTMLCVAITLLY